MSAGQPQERVVTSDEPARTGRFGVGQMESIQGHETEGVELPSTLSHARRVVHFDRSTVHPQRCSQPAAWIGVVLDGQRGRADQGHLTTLGPVDEGDDRFCFAADAVLPLVVERPLETADVEEMRKPLIIAPPRLLVARVRRRLARRAPSYRLSTVVTKRTKARGASRGPDRGFLGDVAVVPAAAARHASPAMSEKLVRSLPIWRHAIRIEPLTGGITNLNWLVTDGERRYVARAGKDDPALGISRRNELDCARFAAAHDLAPQVVHVTDGVVVFEFAAGTPLTPELARDEGTLRRVAAVLARVHAAGEVVEGHLRWFSPFQVARTYLAHAVREGLALPEDAARLGSRVRRLQAAIRPYLPTLCHNDPMPGNLLDDSERVWVIDWEYAGIGHPLFDVAGFASNCDLDAGGDAALLQAYVAAAATPAGARVQSAKSAATAAVSATTRRQFRILKAMAALRESLWGVVQGSQSTIAFDYAGYRDENFAKFRRFAAGL